MVAQPVTSTSGAGRKQGASWGAKLGGWLGNLAQTGIQKILGMGDYQVSPETPLNSNTLINPSQGVPVMHSDAFGAIRVSHREFLTDISSVFPAGRLYQFVLNPADGRTFPWLSGISRSFTQWKLLGCCFEFRSTCGDAVSSTNSALGSVSFGTQYDVTRPIFSSKQAMLNSFWSGSAKPSVDQMHCIECEPSQTPLAPLYIRQPVLTGTIPGGNYQFNDGAALTAVEFQSVADARLFDHGRMEMIILGQQDTFNVGELWITYDLLLMKPVQIPPSTGDTWDGPPSVFADPNTVFTHHAEVALAAVLPLGDPLYPTELKEID